jgi:hypothetical protein
LPLGDWWINGAYFLGKSQTDPVPPLVTMGGSGIPGAPGVNVLQGNQRIEYPFSSGFRLDSGLWIDRCHNWGIEGSIFTMDSRETSMQAVSGNSVLARPFVQQPGNLPAVDLIASPGVSQGWAYADSPLTFLRADTNVRMNLYCEDNYRLDLLGGYRYMRLTEAVNVHTYSTFSSGAISENQDSFQTRNAFNGGQIGLAGEYRFDRLFLSGSMKVAFGSNWHELDVNGWTRTQSPGGNSTIVPAGLLAQGSNSGSTFDQRWAVSPEANFWVGYQVTDHWRALFGYTFVYISSVARPGPAIDTNIGVTANGVTHPTILNPNSDFWMHGINFAIEARY